MTKCIGKFRLGWRGQLLPTFKVGQGHAASISLQGELIPTFGMTNPVPYLDPITWIGDSSSFMNLREHLFPVWHGYAVGVHSAGAPDDTAYMFNNVGLHKGIIVQDERKVVRRNVQNLNFVGDDIQARPTVSNNRVDIFCPPESFEPTISVTWNGGPYNGLGYAEKGYVGDALNIDWATNDPVNAAITSFDQLTLNGSAITLDVGFTIENGGDFTDIGMIDEAYEGSGVSVRLHTILETVTLSGGIEWLFRSYWGNRPSQTIDEAGVKALANSALRGGKAGLYPIGPAASNYKWVCYPTSFGLTNTSTGFKDDLTGFFVPMVDPIVVDVTNGFGVSQDYYCYRSYYPLGGTVKVRIV